MTAELPFTVREIGQDSLRAVAGEFRGGFSTYVTLSLPDRVFTGVDEANRPPVREMGKRASRYQVVPSPLEQLLTGETGTADAWPTTTRRSLKRLEAMWLLMEDRLRLLDITAIEPLAHQAALVQHILQSPDLRRVLIADEVGLGKTLEAGLIIERLFVSRPQLRVLYLTEARLAANVYEEFQRLSFPVSPRLWTADTEEARLDGVRSDSFVIASMHKAVAQRARVAASGPWDVIVVDEAHHLTDYSPEGYDPRLRMELVRTLVNDRLVSDGRLILMSGTPHQGHRERFVNLLRLLSESGDRKDARGRVIYRIKDDIRDWEGRPLFPLRQINSPIEVEVGPDYQFWLADVHSLLEPGPGASRAAGWRRAQALQWCASSPQAGLAYLVRLALRSPGIGAKTPGLAAALAALRPYRGGPINEPIDGLARRITKQAIELDEDVDVSFSGGLERLLAVLNQGTSLVEADAFGSKLAPLVTLLEQCAPEKVVVFAQPIETVYALQDRLSAVLGPASVSIIVGAQDAQERRAQIDRFKRDPKVRVLVSSRAGGEGINLQVARRLVHFDVPWNPMELEQRVGRVHRFGSIDTIVVDTLLFKDSRESRVLERARARLGRISHDLDRERAELIFSRTMSLIPLDELANLMAGENFGPMTPAEEDRLDQLIADGYERYQKSEADFRAHQADIAGLDRGPVRIDDLASWLTKYADAKPLTDLSRAVLYKAEDSDARNTKRVAVEALRLSDGRIATLARDPLFALQGSDGRHLEGTPLGLNMRGVADVLRNAIDGSESLGAGAVLLKAPAWGDALRTFRTPEAFAAGGLLLASIVRRIDDNEQELSSHVASCLITLNGETLEECTSDGLAAVIRALSGARHKQRASVNPAVHPKGLRWMYSTLGGSEDQVMVGVFPWAAILIEVD